jgi:hypothetical protein
MFDFDTFEKSLKTTFDKLTKSQAEALSIEIAANFTAGMSAAETHKSFKSEEPEEDGLTNKEKAEISALAALYLGYISKFNDTAQDQILTKAKDILDAGGSKQDVKKYLDDVLTGNENIVIDNTGQKRKSIYVDENLKLSEVTRTVQKPFFASVLVYASLLGENAAHTSYEAGRKAQYQRQGFDRWMFTGPADERARPWHIALLGQVYKYGTVQSEYAESCLREPRCRHRAQVYYGDSRDVPAERWEKLKKDLGLHWDDEKMEWSINI